MAQIPLDNINFYPLDIWGFQVAAATEDLFFSSAQSNNAVITQQGTNGINGTAFSGHVLDFDGVNDYVQCNNTTSLFINQSFFIEAWINPSTVTGSQAIWSNNVDDFNARGVVFYLRDNVLRSLLRQDASNQYAVESTATLVANKWQKVSITYDGSQDASGVTYKIDDVDAGQNIIQNDTVTNITSAASSIIGAYREGTQLFFSGQIQDLTMTRGGVDWRKFKYLEGKESLLFDSVAKVAGTINGAVWNTGLSGLENGETHNGIPQNVNREWNLYQQFLLADSSYLSRTNVTLNVGDYVEMSGFVDQNGANQMVLSETGVATVDFISLAQSGAVQFRLNSTNHIHTNSPNFNEVNTLRLERISSTQYELTLNGVTETFNDSGALRYSTFCRFGTTATYYNAIPVYIDSNGTIANRGNSWSGWALNNVTKILPIPEDPNSIGNDIFGEAIVGSGFRFDGLQSATQSIDSNYVAPISWNTAFKVEFKYTALELGNAQSIIGNNETSPSFIGLRIRKTPSDVIELYLSQSTSNRIRINSGGANTVELGVEQSHVIELDGSGTVAGLTWTIDDVEISPVVSQDNLVSGANSSNNIIIGGRPLGGAESVVGIIEDIKLTLT